MYKLQQVSSSLVSSKNRICAHDPLSYKWSKHVASLLFPSAAQRLVAQHMCVSKLMKNQVPNTSEVDCKVENLLVDPAKKVALFQ